MQCMFGLEHCTLARGQATPIEGVYMYPLLLEVGWLPGGGCMKSGGFVQGVTKRVGQREGKYSCIAHNKDSYPCGGVAVVMTAHVHIYLGT